VLRPSRCALVDKCSAVEFSRESLTMLAAPSGKLKNSCVSNMPVDMLSTQNLVRCAVGDKLHKGFNLVRLDLTHVHDNL